jgi:LemA protein
VTGTQIAALVAAALLFFWMVGAYNRLVRLRNALAAAWGQFDAQLQRRAAALPGLLEALRSAMVAEGSTMDGVAAAQRQVQSAADAMRGVPVRPDSAAALVVALGQLDSTLTRLLSLLDQHPDLRALDAVAAPLRELHDVDLRLAFARQLFNVASEDYNAAVDQFPTRLLVGFFRFGPAGRL